MGTLEDYESTEEAAARLGLRSPRLVQRWCKQGKLPCKKVGRDWLVKRDAEPSVLRRQAKLKEDE